MKRNKLVSVLFSEEELNLIHKRMSDVFNKSGKMLTQSTFIRVTLMACLENVSPPSNDTKSEDDSQNVTEDVTKSEQGTFGEDIVF